MASKAPAPKPDVPHQTNWKGALVGLIFALLVLGVAGASIAASANNDTHHDKEHSDG